MDMPKVSLPVLQQGPAADGSRPEVVRARLNQPFSQSSIRPTGIPRNNVGGAAAP
jgi:hypothetical protein